MPAKKKAPTRETPAGVSKALERTIRELASTKEKLELMTPEYTKVSERLTRTERVCDAEVAFWKKEVERLQQVAVDAVISAAVKR